MKKKPVLSNEQKIFWPEEKITKGDLLHYYDTMSAIILPYLKNRPLSLKRNPDGIKTSGFYHKDAGNIAPEWMDTADFYADSSHKTIHYLVANNRDSLLYVANLGCIEMNPWNSTVKKPDHPDYIVIDLDPSEKNNFDDVITVALAVKKILDKGKLTGFCKTSGASGMHIYLPCRKKYTYGQARDFAQFLGQLVTEELPELTTLERSLSKRKKNKVYVDYLQNSRGQTLASAYSVRPVKGATVSAPLNWNEVKPGLSPSAFTLKNMLARVKKKGDLFKGVLGKGIDIRRAIKLLDH